MMRWMYDACCSRKKKDRVTDPLLVRDLLEKVRENDAKGFVRLLLETGNPNIYDDRGFSVLHKIVLATNRNNLHQNFEFVRILLQGGARADAVCDSRFSVLQTAARRVLPDIVQLLLDYGADPHFHDADSNNPRSALEYAGLNLKARPDDAAIQQIYASLSYNRSCSPKMG